MIVVDGRIRGKQRPRVCNGHAFTPKQTVEYENWVRLCFMNQGGQHIEGSIKANIIAYFEIPKSYSKKRVQAIKEGREYPSRKLDTDNIAKIILDSLNKIAFDDDSQVVELTVIKRYTEELERVEFELEEIRLE